MAIEQLRADSLNGKNGEVVYVLTDQASTIAAKALLLSTAPSSFNGLPLKPLESTVTEEAETEGAYIGRAVYGTGGGAAAVELDVGDTRISINALGGSTRISHSLETINTYGQAADFDRAIGVDEDGNVQGTDILTGGLEITISKIMASDDLDTSYLAALLALCTPNPTTNTATFSHTDTDGRAVSLAAGEGLFKGFTTSPRGNGEDELRLTILGSKNLTGQSVGSIGSIAKGGWHHLWVRFREQEDAGNGVIVSKPETVKVDRIYEAGDWSAFDL